jgi:hypothetical protein
MITHENNSVQLLAKREDMLDVNHCIGYLNEFANQNNAFWEVNYSDYSNGLADKVYVHHNKSLIYEGTLEQVTLWLNHLADVF